LVKKGVLILALLASLLPTVVWAQLPMLLDRGTAQLVGVPMNQNPGSISYAGDTAYFFGDSVTLGFNPTQPQPQPNLTNRFSTLLCAQYSMIESNASVSGSQIADAQADQITTNTFAISNSTVSVWLAGYNDVFWFGTNAAALTDNFAAVESLAAWLAIPTSVRVPETDNNFGVNTEGIYFPPGNWGTLPAALGGLSYSTATEPASFFFSGSTLLIGTARLDSNSGSVAVTVGDYVNDTVMPAYATNIYSCVRTSPPTGPGNGSGYGGRTYSPGLIIITNLTANRHYCFFTPQSTAFTFFGWYAAYATNQLPKVLLAGTLKIAGSNYMDPNLPAGYVNGSDLAVAEYSQMLSNAAATLSGVGLNVTWAPVPILNSNTDYFYDGIHPDASGHLKIANALGDALGGITYGTARVSLSSSENPSGVGGLVAFTGTLPSDATGNLVFLVDGAPVATNALSNGQATYSTAALTTGLHTIAVNYSGDANYSPSQSSLSQRVAAGIPPVNWNPPAAISYGTALSVLELNATSSVVGTFTYAPTAGKVLNAGTNTLTAVFVPVGTNYSTVTNTVSLTVLPAALTVTANSTNRNVNTGNPAFTGSIIGIQNSDNITATYSTIATTNSPAGTYPIVPSLIDPGGRLVNYTVTTNNGILTVNLASAQICNFFGDSVTLGFNPTPPQPQPNLTNRFSTLLCANLSMIENNAGVGGSEIADAQADMITTNTYAISNSTVSVWLAGYNDVFWFGTNAAALTDNSAAVQSLAAWLAIPTSLRVPSSDNTLNGYIYGVSNSTIFFPSGWAPLSPLGGLEYSSQANPATFYFSGSTLLIGTARLSGDGGDVKVQVGDDVGGTLGPLYVNTTYSCLRTSADTGPGPPQSGFGNRAFSPGLIIITNLTANRHYCLFTPQSTANTFLGWYAAYATNQLPKVVLAGTLKIAGSNYSDPNLPSGYVNGSDLAVTEYSQMLSNAAVTLSAVGLNVKWVPVPVLNSNTDYFYDGIHPDASGHAKIEAAIQSGF
jgi:lysophospholipase L1-like esterase